MPSHSLVVVASGCHRSTDVFTSVPKKWIRMCEKQKHHKVCIQGSAQNSLYWFDALVLFQNQEERRSGERYNDVT